jgi:hypothetical protein
MRARRLQPYCFRPVLAPVTRLLFLPTLALITVAWLNACSDAVAAATDVQPVAQWAPYIAWHEPFRPLAVSAGIAVSCARQ